MGCFQDLTGNKYGRLIVIERDGRKNKRTTWRCKCECGNEKVIAGADLKSGRVHSCGCLKKELMAAKQTTHGMCRTRLHAIWGNMKARCYNDNNKEYHRYGGRGIKVCEEWCNDFIKFNEWAISNGYREGLQIDRIDNDGNYEPSNCRWVTKKENGNNTSKSIRIQDGNMWVTVEEYARKIGKNKDAVYWLKRSCQINAKKIY